MDIKLLPYNTIGTTAIAAVTAQTVTPVDRAAAPYPPGKVQVNSLYFINGATTHGTVTLSWAHRIRTAQAQRAIVAQDASSTSGTIEGTYTVEVLIAGVVIGARTQTGITGTSFTYSYANRVADDADLTKTVQFRITPVNGALSGRARTTDPFLMAS